MTVRCAPVMCKVVRECVGTWQVFSSSYPQWSVVGLSMS